MHRFKTKRGQAQRVFMVFMALLAVIAWPGCRSLPSTGEREGPEADDAARARYLAAQENLAVIERSDWINVTTDVEPAAVGDGVQDDTAAIQAALDEMSRDPNLARPVYLPPGVYRITDTLTVGGMNGGAIYGHGRATRLVWDGGTGEPARSTYDADVIKGARMFHSNGYGRCLYFGLTFDGRGKAAVGVDHDSKSKYETRVRYQYCAFFDFTDSGIRVGHDQKTASAEMMFYDTLFENCRRGISTLAFNDYDNAVARCIFRNCETGVFCHRGNFYVRDSHFESSRAEDLLLPPHSHSVRRCTSRGSAAFIRGSQIGHYSLLLHIQDCLVRGWTSEQGALQLQNAGPTFVFDSVFEAPAVAESAAIALRNPPDFVQTLLTANVDYADGVVSLAGDSSANRVEDIPRDRPRSVIATRAGDRWRQRPELPNRIFDAVTDFGADPTGRADASAAIQQAIDAAAATRGGLAEAYLPAGTYAVEKTLRLKAGAYHFGGAQAWRTQLVGRPSEGNTNGFTVVHVHNADGLTIKKLRIEGPTDVDLTGLHVTADQPGSLVLDGIWSGGAYKPRFKGTHLDRLPGGFRVRSPHLDGELTIDHCGDADILLDYWFTGYDGPLTVRGPTGSGFVGVHSAAGALCNPDITVEDNASIVFGDFYTEQTQQHLLAGGRPDLPPGRVTLSNAKLATRRPDVVAVNGYRGLVTVARANMLYKPKDQKNANERGTHEAVLPVRGNGETTLLLLGTAHFYAEPAFDVEGADALRIGAVLWRPAGESGSRIIEDSPRPADWAETVNHALDHFHELSLKELDG